MVAQRVTFSTVTREDLKKAGVMRKRLVFDAAKVNALIMTRGLTPHAATETVLLHARLKNIYAHVNMDVRLVFHPFCVWASK
jgi:hypothetical protein